MENRNSISLWELFILLFVPFLGMLWFISDIRKKSKSKEKFGSGEENLYI